MNDYHHSDEWSGGAWLAAGDKAAVIFVGARGKAIAGTDAPMEPTHLLRPMTVIGDGGRRPL